MDRDSFCDVRMLVLVECNLHLEGNSCKILFWVGEVNGNLSGLPQGLGGVWIPERGQFEAFPTELMISSDHPFVLVEASAYQTMLKMLRVISVMDSVVNAVSNIHVLIQRFIFNQIFANYCYHRCM